MPSYKYARPAVTVDNIIFTIQEERLKILLINRGIEPFKSSLALPGGFVRVDESLADAAKRELTEETSLSDFHIKMFGMFDDINRDPRDRVITIGFYAIIPSHDIDIAAGSDAENVDWYDFNDIPALAFDHNSIVTAAFNALKQDLENSSIAALFLDDEFTLAEFQNVYEIILTKKVDKRNFRKSILADNLLIKTDNMKSGGQHRPAALYKIASGENEKSAVDNNNFPSLNVKKTNNDSTDELYQKGYNKGLEKGYVSGFKNALSKTNKALSRLKPDIGS